MTKPKPDPAPKPTPARKRILGYLICERCQRAVSYQGYDPVVSESEPWPQHRCGLEVRPFDRFALEDPFRSSLPRVMGEAS